MELLVEVAGWLGAGLILAAYGLLTAGKLQARSVAYQAMNMVGAMGFIVNSGYYGAIPSAALNVVWAGIGGVALWRISRVGGSSTSATSSTRE
jgi:hypothetical protein